jgi:hypothetical protein
LCVVVESGETRRQRGEGQAFGLRSLAMVPTLADSLPQSLARSSFLPCQIIWKDENHFIFSLCGNMIMEKNGKIIHLTTIYFRRKGILPLLHL